MAQTLADKYGATASPLTDTNSLYMAVESGTADALVMNSPTNDYRLQQSGGQDLKAVGDKLSTDESSYAVTKGNAEVLKRINKGLKDTKDSGKFKELHAKWFGK